MSWRIRAAATEENAEIMLAATSLDVIAERLKRMVSAGRGMIMAVRECTYLERPPILIGGLKLATNSPSGGFRVFERPDDLVTLDVELTTDGSDQYWFGASERTYQHSGNESEAKAWSIYNAVNNGGKDKRSSRRNMTHVQFTGGLPGWKWKTLDRVVITNWNDDGVAFERTLGFMPGRGSW